MHLLLLIASLISFVLPDPHGGEQLLRIRVHGKFGFIDTTGKVVIEPRFANVGAFHEGLAVAREPRGLYGYIDPAGSFVIAPQFEFALPLSEGFAICYQHERGHFIRRDGSDAFGFTFVRASQFESGRSRVELENDRWNLIDTGGRKLIDSNVEYIHEFHHGFAVVAREDYFREFGRMGVVDHNGRIRFYLDSISELSPFEDGFFSCTYTKVTRNAKGEAKYSIAAADVDPDGHMFEIPDDQIDSYIELNRVSDNDIIRNASYSANLPESIRETVIEGRQGYVHSDGRLIWKSYEKSIRIEAYERDITYQEDLDYPPITVDGRGISPTLRYIGQVSYGDSFPVDQATDSSLSGVRIRVDACDTIRATIENVDQPSLTRSLLGLRVTLENHGNDTILLSGPSKDELFMLQARDGSGEWKDIEQLVEGDVSDALYIPPHRMHLTICPIMRGYLPTMLRIRCDIYTADSSVGKVSYDYSECRPTCIYSNEFAGSVNPAQFWRSRYEKFMAGDDD